MRSTLFLDLMACLIIQAGCFVLYQILILFELAPPHGAPALRSLNTMLPSAQVTDRWKQYGPTS